MRFDFTVINEWKDPGDGGGECASVASSLSAEERLFLFSDGSLTLHLEALFEEPVRVELLESDFTGLTGGTADYLVEQIDQRALEREVWLLTGGTRHVYAYSVMPLASVEPWLIEALVEGDEPIGKILQSREIPVLKEGLEIAVVSSDGIARALGIAPDTPLFARRYKLLNKDSSGEWIIKAMVIEVISPELVRVP